MSTKRDFRNRDLIPPIMNTFLVSVLLGPPIGGVLMAFSRVGPFAVVFLPVILIYAYPLGIASALVFAFCPSLFGRFLGEPPRWSVFVSSLIPYFGFETLFFFYPPAKDSAFASFASLPNFGFAIAHIGSAWVCWLMVRKSWKSA